MAKQKSNNPTQRPNKAKGKQGKPTIGDWIEGARLRTLPLALVPVILGTASAVAAVPGEFHWIRALGALVVALALQIGVNYSNDYSDGIRGTDDYRVGPPRLTGSGQVNPKTVRNVAFAFFGIAAAAGLALAIATQQWWLLAVGAAAIIAAWFYTGGKRPYGYAGLGEVFVFVFFGLVATVGTTYVQILTVPQHTWVLAVAAGLFSCAVLMVNNIRDRETDVLASKKTLAVRVGLRGSRILFGLFALLPFVATILFGLLYPNTFFSFFALLLIGPAVVITSTSTAAKDLILALKLTSLGALLWAVLMAFGLWIPAFS
ncbi:1,4-dihydroxy-2-naphthoate polyprenyltransferase [Gulosibacter molinativorax]|uniref:1,4-dihydroxy-2-naphthoate octaprenyltransferase n=1 Tax=Gulosibacter molinativorax TaxID=256821 RepID=A0ABT7CAU0_9MICO|nr:1,4-dihydroxy-2-naphthoate polyprenyltransferase [Gulosibacter molinativorax]MDJ1372318.1 1,4-dihydroxy-2-naphthoate polyprenyltransferase [Gulosibacter molinativorax]QUY63412.1 1,4-dihydroxy-2-naphthoate octaprenyltransferase [Gulosibacter molinativorax]